VAAPVRGLVEGALAHGYFAMVEAEALGKAGLGPEIRVVPGRTAEEIWPYWVTNMSTGDLLRSMARAEAIDQVATAAGQDLWNGLQQLGLAGWRRGRKAYTGTFYGEAGMLLRALQTDKFEPDPRANPAHSHQCVAVRADADRVTRRRLRSTRRLVEQSLRPRNHKSELALSERSLSSSRRPTWRDRIGDQALVRCGAAPMYGYLCFRRATAGIRTRPINGMRAFRVVPNLRGRGRTRWGRPRATRAWLVSASR
jgi:hypothetical protein